MKTLLWFLALSLCQVGAVPAIAVESARAEKAAEANDPILVQARQYLAQLNNALTAKLSLSISCNPESSKAIRKLRQEITRVEDEIEDRKGYLRPPRLRVVPLPPVPEPSLLSL